MIAPAARAPGTDGAAGARSGVGPGAVVALCAIAACNGDDGMHAPDGGPGGDSEACTRPSLDQPWLAQMLRDLTSVLAGAPRATTTQRGTARSFIGDQLVGLGLVPELHAYATGTNVHATLASTTGATERIIVGAHFDSVAGSPGANDNATGVAAVLAVARYATALPCRRAAITFVLLDEEETGLVGARAYSGTLAPGSVIAVHTIDQIGWDADRDRRFELERPTAALEGEYRAAAAVVGVAVSTTATEGTDHQAFREDGFAAIGLTEEFVGGDTTPHRHTPQDSFGTVELGYLELGTRLVAQVVLAELSP